MSQQKPILGVADKLQQMAGSEQAGGANEREQAVSIEAAWEAQGRVHDVQMRMFVSVMRIRFAWIIFSLIVAWLISNLVLVYASALGKINLIELYALCGAGLGVGIGWILSSLNASRNLQEEISKAEQTTGDIAPVILRKVWGYNQKFGKYTGIGAAVGLIVTATYAYFRHPQPCEIKIAAGVLIALITTTTASVVGLLAIVMNWLFPKEHSSHDR